MTTQKEVYEVLKKYCKDEWYTTEQIKRILTNLGKSTFKIGAKLSKLSRFFRQIKVRWKNHAETGQVIREYKYVEVN